MQDKELEKILQEKADQIKIRSFNEVWQDIKSEIEGEKVVPTKPKKLGWKKWISLSMASCATIVALILTPILLTNYKPNPEELFYTDELSKQEVSVEDMFEGLSDAGINYADLSNYTIYETLLYLTEDNVTKGAEIKLISENNIPFLAEMKIYAKDVELNLELEKDYDTSCKVNSADVYYKFKQEINGLYYYSIYAVYNNVQYVMEYTGFSDNITEFFDSFFA